MVSLWDVLPVDWLPLSVSVGCAACGLWIGCRGLCRSVGWSATVPAVRVSDGEPVGCAACAVVSTLDTLPAVSLWDWLPWSVPSTPCQPVSLCRGLCVDGLPVVAGMCCLSVSL